MNIITDNLKADNGIITYTDGEGDGEDVLKMGGRFREKLGFMPQYPGMYPTFTVERFLWYMAALKDVGAHLKGKTRKQYIADEIAALLKAVELDDVPHRKISALSGGMKQRLALAQAVLGDSKILILDEPTAVLTPQALAGSFLARMMPWRISGSPHTATGECFSSGWESSSTEA